MRGLSLKGSVRAALGEELDSIHFGDKFSGQTEGSPRARDEAEGLEPCLGWAERAARLRGHQAVLGAVGKTRETLTQLGDHPTLFSQKSQSGEGSGLRTQASLRCHRRGRRDRAAEGRSAGARRAALLGPQGAVSAGHWAGGRQLCMATALPCPPAGAPCQEVLAWGAGRGGLQGGGLHHCPGGCPALVAMLCWPWGG